ncbi:MAG: 3D domain-containing protein [Defluviitaleaceae bacterium]|nr:3D domain-containing protein [Defluviitaleaceae bacterium]MCL2240771.1 3D domain-containing protein [Defluviitaleaceae bacterium]
MHRIRAVCAVLGFALVATILLPLVVFDFTAADEDFPIVTIHHSGQVHQHETAAQTVGELMQTVGIITTELDRVSYPSGAYIYHGMEIRVNPAIRFYVATDSNAPIQWTVRYGTTVADILAQVQDRYDKAFLYTYELDRQVATRDRLQFTSWRSRYYTEIVEIAYEVIQNHTGAVRYGRTHARQRGVPGEQEVTVNVVYIGGYEDSRTITETYMISVPVDAIYDIGTAQLGALTNPNAPDFHYVRRVRMHATAYCACILCTGRPAYSHLSGVTASGRRVQHGIVAVDTSVIPFGTHLYVEGYGFAVAADRGSAIVGYSIDLFMYNHADALRFGRRDLNVWILN